MPIRGKDQKPRLSTVERQEEREVRKDLSSRSLQLFLPARDIVPVRENIQKDISGLYIKFYKVLLMLRVVDCEAHGGNHPKSEPGQIPSRRCVRGFHLCRCPRACCCTRVSLRGPGKCRFFSLFFFRSVFLCDCARASTSGRSRSKCAEAGWGASSAAGRRLERSGEVPATGSKAGGWAPAARRTLGRRL